MSSSLFVSSASKGVITKGGIGATGNEPSVSPDGAWVAFHSTYSNLVSGDTNGASDVFIHDVDIRQTKLISKNKEGVIGDNISFQAVIAVDGDVVFFTSFASNLGGDPSGGAQVYSQKTPERNPISQTTGLTQISITSNGVQGNGGSFTLFEFP